MRIVVSFGHSALDTSEATRARLDRFEGVEVAARALHVLLDAGHEVVATHAHEHLVPDARAPGDVPDARGLAFQEARADGIAGYLLEQVLRSGCTNKRSFVNVITHTLIDERDPSFAAPARPVGPAVGEADARRLERERHWTMRREDERWRRVVAAPEPVTILQSGAIATLLGAGHTVLCSGGGIAVSRDLRGRERGSDALVDADLGAGLLAREIGADALLLATDVVGVQEGWPGPERRRLPRLALEGLDLERFECGTMRPKVDAAARFVRHGGRAAIGPLGDLLGLLEGRSGTTLER